VAEDGKRKEKSRIKGRELGPGLARGTILLHGCGLFMTGHERFLDKLRNSLAENGGFVKLTLSHAAGPDADMELSNLYARPVKLHDGEHVQCVWHYATRDVTKNFPRAEAADFIIGQLDTTFLRANLFTTIGDFQWRGPGAGKFQAKRPSFAALPQQEHNRQKVRAVSAEPWLVALGVTAPDGTARPGMADKLRQIERFVELLGHSFDEGPLKNSKEVHVADLGAGKGYLTFAAHDFLKKRGIAGTVTGVEQRADLVEKIERVARECGCDGLNFVPGDIASYAPPSSLDVLIALHACDMATDDALALGVRFGAQLILAAPCCHREVRPKIDPPEVLAPVFRHGILFERYAEILTDSIRALVLEINGYRAKVHEFISPEHTGKNLMISAQRMEDTRDPAPLKAQLQELLEFHRIEDQRLAKLLHDL
jgi:SAM-dependent methyltransferase